MTRRVGIVPIDGIEWRLFMESPATYAKPQWLVGCFGGAVSEAACERLLGTKRLKDRLSKLLHQHYRLPESMAPEPAADEMDKYVALASTDSLAQVALRAGAVYWAGSFTGVILGHKTAALQEALGIEVYRFAVANRDLTGPLQSLEPIESIRERVLADGWRCLVAWCHTLPATIGKRVRLKLPSAEPGAPQPPFANAGPIIVRRVAA